MKGKLRYVCTVLILMLVFVMGVLQANATNKNEIYYSHEWRNPLYEEKIVNSETSTFRSPFSLKRTSYTSSYEEAGQILRNNMINRIETTTIYFEIPGLKDEEVTDEFLGNLCDNIYQSSLEHTGNPKEGDALKYAITYYNANVEGYIDEAGVYLTINYNVYYFSIKEMEDLLDTAVVELLTELNLEDKTDFDKIKTVYDYMVANIEYDYEGLENNAIEIYTAYAALVEKSAVCQGYALLFYRLMLECEIDARVITGFSHDESHAWNIVKLGDVYYYVDATWDSTWDSDKKHHDYFLKGKFNFSDHEENDEFKTTKFQNMYPISIDNYVYIDEPEEETFFTEGDYTYTVENNKAKLYKYLGIENNIVIPSKLGGYDVTIIGCNAFTNNDFIQSVTIPNSVVEIENANTKDNFTIGDGIDDGAFYNCGYLLEVVIEPDSQLELIGRNSFAQCRKLEKIILPDSIKCVNVSAFDGCSSLKVINLPEGLEQIGQNAFAFSNIESLHVPSTCSSINWIQNIPSLKEIVVAEGNEYYKSFNGALYENNEKKGWILIIYPESKADEYYAVADFAEYVLTDAFLAVDIYNSDKEPNLKKLNIGNCDGVDVFGIQSLSRIRCEIEVPDSNPFFKNYDGMVLSKDEKDLVQVPSSRSGTLVIPDGVTRIKDYACEYSDIIELVVPDSVQIIETAAFWNCEQLVKVRLSNQLNEIPTAIFQNCYSLKDIQIPSNITKICLNAFLDCYELEEIILPEGMIELEAQVFAGCRSLKSVVIPDGVKKIGYGAFGICTSLEEIILPEDLDEIGTQLFFDCHSLKSIVLPENLKNIPENMFGNSAIQTIVLPKNIESIGRLAFHGTALNTIFIPKTVEYIGEQAFVDCRYLDVVYYEGTEDEWSNIVVGDGNEALFTCLIEYSSDGLQESGEYTEGFYTFFKTGSEAKITNYCGDEIDVVIPSMLGGVKVTSIGRSAFRNNTTVEKITFPSSIKKIEGDFGEGAFSECYSLKEIVIPVDSELSSIGRHSFYMCSNLSKITLPNSVRVIEMEAFTHCSTLENINLPEGLEQVEQCVFAFSSIRTLCIPSTCYYFDYTQRMVSLEEITVAEGNEKYRSHEGVLYEDKDYRGWSLVLYPAAKSGETYTVADYAKHINCDTFGSQFLYQDNNDPELKVLNIGNCNGFDGAGNVSFSKICCEIIVPTTNPYYMNYDGMVLSKDGTVLVQVPRNREGKIIIPEGITTISSYAFESCNVSEVIMPDSVCVIGEGVFENCRKLQKVRLSNQLDEIKVAMFRDCIMLSSIKLPVNIKNIRIGAFFNCYSLKEISLPSCLEMISTSAFFNCYSLQTIKYEGTQEEWNKILVEHDNDVLKQVQIFYSVDMNEPTSIAGDANGDGEIDTKDVTVIRRFIVGGYGISIDEVASDVNDDGVVDTKDVTMIRRFIVGGYGVTLS